MTPDVVLFNLDPALAFFGLGATLGCIPLAWWWWRQRGSSPLHNQRSLAQLVLFLTFDLVLFGAFTRLTDSGLGCPDWPGCYAHASPVGASKAIQEAQDLMPSGPVTHTKAWIEMIHRYLATSVGALLLVLCVSAWIHRLRTRSQAHLRQYSPYLPTLSLLWVCAVGLFGALTVTMKLQPSIVTLHLLGALILLALLTLQLYDLRRVSQPIVVSPLSSLPWRAVTVLVFILVFFQIALGGWVSTNYAVLACHTFPTCNGQWWPTMNFEQGFTIWRPLGFTQFNELLDISALHAIHYTHRLFAYLVLGVLWLYCWLLFKSGQGKMANIILTVSLLQLLSGVANVLLKWPLPIALIHSGGAAVLVIAMSWQTCVQFLSAKAPAPSSPGA